MKRWRVLETERLRLRWLCGDDAAFMAELVNDPSWVRFIGDRGVRSEEDARALIETRYEAAYLRDGFGLWAMERRDDEALVGICGLVRRASLPCPDLGYAMLPRHWGAGYATEAAVACLAYAERTLGLTRVLAITSPDNERSKRVLERVGMQERPTTILEGETAPSARFEWQSPAAPLGDRAAIDALVGRFFASFVNKDGPPAALAALPHLFAQGATITKTEGTRSTTTDVRDFLVPRAELLTSGRLSGFGEGELEARTELAASFAQRWSRYRRAGTLDGRPFSDVGEKAMTFVKTEEGWKILALVW